MTTISTDGGVSTFVNVFTCEPADQDDLVSTLLALILASVLTHGVSITGLSSWATATIVVWLVTALATVILGKLIVPAKA